MWLIADFEAVTLFSLKMSTATASGGKTLLAPTPYAIKMALLDVACRHLGVEKAEERWDGIRDLKVALCPARRAVVTNLFQKVLRPRKKQVPLDNPEALSKPDAGFFQRTIGYREYVHLEGVIGIALGWGDEAPRPWLADVLSKVSYLGKRGGFIQMVGLPKHNPELPEGYIDLTQETMQFSIGGTLQLLDDCTPDLTFEKANIYSSKSIRMGKERILRSIILPYKIEKSSRSFTSYTRTDL